LHGWVRLQVVAEHALFPKGPRQAVPTGQSLAVLQPHLPATHATPLVPAVQSTHTPPCEPHCVAPLPATQVPLAAAEQQPPLHG
jgi:hypothetical protein